VQRPPITIPTVSRRTRRLLIAVGIIAVLAILWFNFVGVFVEYLWFGEVGHREVFATQLYSRAALFLIGALVSGGAVFGAMVLAYRSRPVFVPTDEVDPLAPYRLAISKRPKLIAIGLSAAVGLISGLSIQANWTTVQLWLNGTTFGSTDAEFGKDVGWYVFDLPMYQLVLGWLFVLVGMLFVVVAVVQYLYAGLRFSGPGRRITTAASIQLSLLVGLFVLVKAVQYWFDRYTLLFSNRSAVFTGASYTDIHAVLPAKLILMFIAAICAIGFFVGAFVRSLKLPAIAVALLVLSGVLIGGAWPLILQSIKVKPSEITLEKEYIERNIAATREAYGIGADKVKYDAYVGATDGNPASLLEDRNTVPNARLLDPNLLSPTFIQRQQLQNFYSFPNQLSVDRYTINGKTEDYIVAVREMNIASLSENQQTWINEHLVYTHGNGFVAAPASEISSQRSGGDGFPKFTVSDVGLNGQINQGVIKVDQPRIYFGQLGSDYSIVGAASDQNPREYDAATSNYTYTGSGGVPVGNFFRKLIFATQYGEPNFIFSSEVNDASKIIYNRDPIDRIKKVAPFLTTDTKPYPAVVGGRILWIVDGYTTATNYPYAQRVSLSDATNTSQVAQGAIAQVNEQVSYIRNSVKATVDAYTGEVKLYEADGQDPILKAWRSVFPDLITPASQVSDELRAHFRYPQDLFEVQRALIAKYQVSNGTEFYQTSGFWQVPNDPTAEGGAANAAQPPYYLQLALPGEETPSFQLTSALSRFKRENIGGYIAVSSDPANYGQIRVLSFPSDTTTPGPAQVQQNFRNDQSVANQITLLGAQNVKYGNLMTLPLQSGLLYIEPVYVQTLSGGNRAYPVLNLVLVWYGSRVGLGGSIADALRNAAANAPVGPTSPGTGGTTTPTTTTPPLTTSSAQVTLPADAAAALSQVDRALTDLSQAKSTGNFADVGAAQDRLNAAVENYIKVAGPAVTAPSGTTAAPPTTS
jgi:uncharacterized protein